jgi:hypothetical protein
MCEERVKGCGSLYPRFQMDFEDFLRDGVELDETVRVLSEAPYNVALAARTWRSKVSRKPSDSPQKCSIGMSKTKKRRLPMLS